MTREEEFNCAEQWLKDEGVLNEVKPHHVYETVICERIQSLFDDSLPMGLRSKLESAISGIRSELWPSELEGLFNHLKVDE